MGFAYVDDQEIGLRKVGCECLHLGGSAGEYWTRVGTELDDHRVTTQRRQTNRPAVEPGEFEIGCRGTGGWSEAEPLCDFLLVAYRVERVVVVTVHTAIFVQLRVPRIACSRYCSKPFCKAKRVTPARVLTSALS